MTNVCEGISTYCMCEVSPYPVCRGAAVRGSRRPAPLCLSRRRCGWRWGRVCACGAGCGRGAGSILCCSAAWDTSPGPTPPASWASTEHVGEHCGDSRHSLKTHVLCFGSLQLRDWVVHLPDCFTAQRKFDRHRKQQRRKNYFNPVYSTLWGKVEDDQPEEIRSAESVISFKSLKTNFNWRVLMLICFLVLICFLCF